MDQTSIDELYAVAKVTDGLLTGKAKKEDFQHYVWFYEQVTDILTRAGEMDPIYDIECWEPELDCDVSPVCPLYEDLGGAEWQCMLLSPYVEKLRFSPICYLMNQIRERLAIDPSYRDPVSLEVQL